MEPRAPRVRPAWDHPSSAVLPATNLRLPVDLFVDRVAPRAECVDALRSGRRLITVFGPSGAGKSRLATEVANEVRADFANRIYVIDLSLPAEPGLLLSKIVEVSQVESSDPLFDALREVFRSTSALLILENVERLSDRIRDLLDIAPDLRIIVTSDIPVGLVGELRVPAKELPSEDGAELFLARARRVVTTPDELAQVRTLCNALQEPLAIELAAGLARTSPLGALSRVLESPAFLDLENRVNDAPNRQQTLALAIAWSLECLNPVEQEIVLRLSVLNGPWTEEAAAALVASAVGVRPADRWMAHLLDGGFVLNEPGFDDDPPNESRYRMLFAMRAFGRRRLSETPEAHREVRAAHAGFYRHLVESCAQSIVGPHRLETCEKLSRDHGNIHAALGFYIEVGDVRSAVQMAVVLDTYWWSRGYAEGYASLQSVLGLKVPPDASAEDRLRRGKVFVAAGKLGLRQCDLDQATSFFDEACRIGRAEGSLALEAVALERGALVDIERTSYGEAQAALATALAIFERLGDDQVEGRADCLNGLGTVACELDDELVERLFQEALELYAESAGPQASAWVRVGKAQVAYLKGDLRMARVHAEHVQAVGRQHSESGLLTWSGNVLGHVAVAEDDLATARKFFVESLTLAALQGNLRPHLRALEGLATVASRAGQQESALVLLSAADQVRRRYGLPRAVTEQRLINDAAERSRAELSAVDQMRSIDRGSLLSLAAAIDFARRI